MVTDVRPEGAMDGSEGYSITFKKMSGWLSKKKTVKAKGVIMAGGVLGTVKLLFDMKTKELPNLSNKTGDDIRTNNESLILVHSRQKDKNFSEGVAIGSIFPPDKDSHVEPVRYGSGSGFLKLMGIPMILGKNGFSRTIKLLGHFIVHPVASFRIYFPKNFAEESVILLFMQHLDTTLKFKKGMFNLGSRVSTGKAPSSFIPRAKELAERTSDVVNGNPFVMATEVFFGIPTTAHILGGAVIGDSPEYGVINKTHHIFGYKNLLVCDGSAISANPGVNPSLTITAMTERAMSLIPDKKS